jgi:hypothetical protein
MLGSSWVAAQLAASQEGLSPMSECCSCFVCIWINTKFVISLLVISLYNFHSIKGSTACLLMSFFSSWEVEKFSLWILQCTWDLIHQRFYKMIFLWPVFFMVYALFLQVGWFKIVDIANPFFPHQFKTCRTWDPQNRKLILLSFLLHHKAQDRYTLWLSNTLKLNWLMLFIAVLYFKVCIFTYLNECPNSVNFNLR